ncbi:MAG: hypothetical protein HON53_10700 [Planctomycetaceae bacterium]|nr:hypothetical protein [Planctomycetaceae bacterium]
MKDLKDNPYQIDRFSSTGLYIRPNSSYTQGVFGTQVRGYVDALEPDDRGFVSRLYSEESIGFPPSLPEILRFELADDDRFELEWAESIVREGELRGYRVRVGTTSCGWTYQALPNDESLLNETLDNVLSVETLETSVCGTVPKGTGELFASITPFSSRIDLEPETFFRPSEEARCER